MLSRDIIAAVGPAVVRNLKHWIYHLGGLDFIPLGLRERRHRLARSQLKNYR